MGPSPFLTRYAGFFRTPGVPALLGVALFSRLPMGMVAFAMLMFLREAEGSFAFAGGAVGAYFAGMAAVAPVNGRIIDRIGPQMVLTVTGALQPLALLAVLAAAKWGVGNPAVVLAATLAGAFNPPVSVLMRTIWRHRFHSEEERRLAFSIDAVMIQVDMTVGPAVVAAVLAAVDATAAFVATIAVVVASFLVFVLSAASSYLVRESHGKRHMLGPLAEPRLLIVYAATLGFTVSFGLMEVGYAAYATALTMPAFGGTLLAINSAGAAVGGALYGGMTFKASTERQWSAALGLMALPLFLHAVIEPSVPFAVVAFFAGALISPSVASQLVLVSRLSPAKYATEAFTWASLFIVCGHGVGVALGGVAVEASGAKSVFWAAGAIMCAVMFLALWLRVPQPVESLGPAK